MSIFFIYGLCKLNLIKVNNVFKRICIIYLYKCTEFEFFFIDKTSHWRFWKHYLFLHAVYQCEHVLCKLGGRGGGRLPPHSEIWRILLITFVGEWGFAKCLLFVLATTFSNNTFPFFLFYLLIVITMRLNSVKLRVLIRYYLCFLFFVLQSLVVENIFDKIWGKKTW